MAIAILRKYRQSPRKVRLLADLIRGKKVAEAKTLLQFANKRASCPVSKLLDSAIANASHNEGMKADRLIVKEVRVDEGPTMKRWMPRAQGRATPINKRTSHVQIVVAEETQ
ncbi:MAG: 50S ribosomal protein L22 [bacterium]|nr:50S ribosomal protein L22 [bacterium]